MDFTVKKDGYNTNTSCLAVLNYCVLLFAFEPFQLKAQLNWCIVTLSPGLMSPYQYFRTGTGSWVVAAWI
jgi:hypothetical protein